MWECLTILCECPLGNGSSPIFIALRSACPVPPGWLQDMMHGTLEVKQDALTADAVKKPEWMDEIAAEDMTEEQKKVGWEIDVA